MKPKVNRPVIITCLFIGIFITFINLMRCIFEFDVSTICYFISTLLGVLTFIVLLEYDFDREYNEKETPKKVNKYRRHIKLEPTYFCPVCENRVEKGQKYCKHCGQALDWSDEDDK